MSAWTSDELNHIGAAEELRIAALLTALADLRRRLAAAAQPVIRTHIPRPCRPMVV